MHVMITSEGILAACAVLTLFSGFGLWAVQAIVARELRKLNGRYVYAQGSEITGHEIEERLKKLEAPRAARAQAGI